MPIEHSWLVEGKVILIEMSGELSLEELQASAAQSLDALNQANETLHQIIDFTHASSLANNLSDLSKLSRPVNEHPLLGWVVMYGIQNKLIKFLTTMTGQLTNSKLKSVDTREDATAFLQHVEPLIVFETDA